MIQELEAKVRKAYDKMELFDGQSKDVININYSLRDVKKAIHKLKTRVAQLNSTVDDQIKEIERIKNGNLRLNKRS